MGEDTKDTITALRESAERTTYANDTTAPVASLLEYFAASSYNPTMEIIAEAPEFTCLCPITKQPDFGTIKIRYRPLHRCLESKSFKLYLGSYRNVGMFHEGVVLRIRDDLVRRIQPQWLIVEGDFCPRGGIAFKPIATYGVPLRDDWHATNAIEEHRDAEG